MADGHFRIAKQAIDHATVTGITKLVDGEVVEELARLLGGEEITDAVRENAKELLQTAANKKKELR